MCRKEPEQDGRRRVVGQIADHAHGKPFVGQQRVEVHVEEVRRDDLNVIRHPGWQGGREIAVDLNGDETAHARRQCGGQRAPPGTNFEKRVTGGRLDRANELVHPGRFEEMLAEALPGGGTLDARGRAVTPSRRRPRRAARRASSAPRFPQFPPR
jgi:hypothetical protein